MDLMTARARIHAMFTALDEAAEQELDSRIDDLLAAASQAPATEPTYVSRPLPPRDWICARPECGHSGEEHHHGDTKCWAHLPMPFGSPITICKCSGFVPGPSAEESEEPAQPDRIVAYRNPSNPRTLLCRQHGPRYVDMVPVTADELPDGGICTFGQLSSLHCGQDVLIDPPGTD